MKFNKYKNDKMYYFLINTIKRIICSILYLALALVYLLLLFFILVAAIVLCYSIIFWIAKYFAIFLFLGSGPLIFVNDDGTLVICIFPIIIVTRWY